MSPFVFPLFPFPAKKRYAASESKKQPLEKLAEVVNRVLGD
jgi:hypothetical protein